MSNNPTDSDLDDRSKMSRRDFIKLLGATGAAIPLPSLIPLVRAFGGNTTGTISSNARSQNSEAARWGGLDPVPPAFVESEHPLLQ
jgi:hypothetical protein